MLTHLTAFSGPPEAIVKNKKYRPARTLSVYYRTVTNFIDKFNSTIEKITVLLYKYSRKYGGNYEQLLEKFK